MTAAQSKAGHRRPSPRWAAFTSDRLYWVYILSVWPSGYTASLSAATGRCKRPAAAGGRDTDKRADTGAQSLG